MAMFIGRNRKARTTYGFDEIALVPGNVTINPNEVDITFRVPRKDAEPFKLVIPILASAMDGVVDVDFAIEMGKLGGLAVLNLEGVQTRYKNPAEVLLKVLEADKENVTALLQKIYQEPVQEDLIAARVKEIKDAGVIAAVSSIPQKAERYGRIAQEAGVDVFVVQSTVSTVRHVSTEYKSLDLKDFCAQMNCPIIVGNTVGYDVTLEILECGVAGVLVGVGPGAACTSRGVLGLGVPQVTATVDCAAARDYFYKKTGHYVPIITDGGMSKGGDVCKALACGADAVMIGSAFAKAVEAPGKGYHWGMATPHANLPRGTRIRVGTTGPLRQILFGPADVDDGSQNLVGAITTCMGNVGAANVREFQETEIIIAPSIRTEGKLFQQVQMVGMGSRNS
ncbi:MAG TPA: GuaB3 family IMP dehydrogenase-related protein [Chthoniobacterales bacterium]|jgi:IMP dehydrogenase|nr:GuaB3 family IMP dehydrogenase-related protein [Chthoniobacterales bacterium]